MLGGTEEFFSPQDWKKGYMNKEFKKTLAVILIALMVVFYPATLKTYAQVVSDTPVPSVDVSVSPTDVPTDIPTDIPSIVPTDVPTDVPIDTPTPSDPVATEQGDSPTGTPNNPNPTNTPPTGNAKTGDATSSADLTNTVNTTLVNSQVVKQTINLFIDYTGDLDLSSPATMINAIVRDHPKDPVINVALTGVDNYAYITNNVNTTADTGNNTATGSAQLTTGNATAITSILNQANLVLIDSVLHIITVNIFGNLNGNIILPDAPNPTSDGSAQINSLINDNAFISNVATGSANTGNNTASGSGSLATGNAGSLINIINVANTGVTNADLMGIYINVLGTWDGSFLGWGTLAPEDGSAMLSETSLTSPSGQVNCPQCLAVINNMAVVNNNVLTSANTGGNNVTGGNLTTGNAFSAINIINFINSYFVNSFDFFGIFNIFGNWHGDIGQKSAFPTPTPIPSVAPAIADSWSSNSNKEDGGALSLIESSNVGKYILPGDTMTLFLKGTNTGTGTVYGSTLQIHLIRNGVDLGDPTFNIGDLGAGKSFTMTTGLVIPKSFPAGTYTAHAVLTGTTGNDNTVVTTTADTQFEVFTPHGIQPAFADGNPPVLPKGILKEAVMGASAQGKGQDELPLIYAALALFGGYLILRFRGWIYRTMYLWKK